MNMTLSGFELMKMIGEQQDRRRFQQLNWRGTFADYLDIVTRKPQVAVMRFSGSTT